MKNYQYLRETDTRLYLYPGTKGEPDGSCSLPATFIFNESSLTLMYIDLERDSVIKVRALMTLAAYSVQQTKKRALFLLSLTRELSFSMRVRSRSAEKKRAFFLLSLTRELAKLAIIVSKLAKFAENGVKLLHIPKKVTTFAAYLTI